MPKGSKVVIETQALHLAPGVYSASNVPQLVLDHRAPPTYDEYLKASVEYVVASSQKFGDPLAQPDKFPEYYSAYMHLFAHSRELTRFAPNANHPGPRIAHLSPARRAGIPLE